MFWMMPAIFLIASNFQTMAKEPQAADLYNVMLFMSADCPCSISHEAHLKELIKAEASKNWKFSIIVANPVDDSTYERWQQHFQQAFFEEKSLIEIIDDRNQSFLEKYPANKTPHVFLLRESTGEVVYHGGIDERKTGTIKPNHPYLWDAILAIKQGKDVPQRETRTLGCAIPRKG